MLKKDFNYAIRDAVSKKTSIISSIAPSNNYNTNQNRLRNTGPPLEIQNLLRVKEDKTNHLNSKIERYEEKAKAQNEKIAHFNKSDSSKTTEILKIEREKSKIKNKNKVFEKGN